MIWVYQCICLGIFRSKQSIDERLYRLWYKRGSSSGAQKTIGQLHYRHVIPARLETHPRAFNPKFQTLDVTLDLLNDQLSRGDTVINGTIHYMILHLFAISRSIPWPSRPNKPVCHPSVHMYVLYIRTSIQRPSTRSFVGSQIWMKFGVPVEVDECHTHDVPYYPIQFQGQGHTTFRIRNSSIFIICLLLCLQWQLANN